MNLDFVLVLFIFLYICLVLFGNAIFNKYGDYIIFMCYIWSIIYCLFIYIAAFFIVLYGFNCVFDFCFSYFVTDTPLNISIPEEELSPLFKDCHDVDIQYIFARINKVLDETNLLTKEISQAETIVLYDRETVLLREHEVLNRSEECLDMVDKIKARLSPEELKFYDRDFYLIGEEIKYHIWRLDVTMHWKYDIVPEYTSDRLILVIRAEAISTLSKLKIAPEDVASFYGKTPDEIYEKVDLYISEGLRNKNCDCEKST